MEYSYEDFWRRSIQFSSGSDMAGRRFNQQLKGDSSKKKGVVNQNRHNYGES